MATETRQRNMVERIDGIVGCRIIDSQRGCSSVILIDASII